MTTVEDSQADESSSGRFWRDPPWRGGRTQFQLGVQPIPEAQWLAEPISPAEASRKRALLRERRQDVLARASDGEDWERMVVDWIAARLRARGGYPLEPRHVVTAQDGSTGIPELAPPGLADAALWVAEDLAVLAPSAAGYRLVAACVCAPSFWRLREKIGRSMHEIHGPVAGLNAAIGPRIERFFEGLPEDRVFQRRNYLLHQVEELFHPDDEVWPARLDIEAAGRLYLRSETQTLRRHEGGALLFTIRVASHPLRQIVDYPEAAADLLLATQRMSADERRSFGLQRHGDALRTLLQAATIR
ncbi:MAG: DUF3445 domain-containing protein [Pseudomonadales bacterium]